MVLATATPVPVPDEGRRTAPVAGDALVFPEMRGALFLCACGVTSDVGRKDGSVLTCSRARVISVRPETRALSPEGAQARPSHRTLVVLTSCRFCSFRIAATLASISARFAAFAASSMIVERVG